MIKVLALDTSTHTGWAIGDGLSKPEFGTLHLRGWRPGSIGQAYVQLFDFITKVLADNVFTHVIVERPLTVHAHAYDKGKNADLAAALLGFVAVAECATVRMGVKFNIESPATIRKHFIGHGRHPDPKVAVMARCRQLGWKVTDDNQADALATLDYALSMLRARTLFDAASK